MTRNIHHSSDVRNPHESDQSVSRFLRQPAARDQQEEDSPREHRQEIEKDSPPRRNWLAGTSGSFSGQDGGSQQVGKRPRLDVAKGDQRASLTSNSDDNSVKLSSCLKTLKESSWKGTIEASSDQAPLELDKFAQLEGTIRTSYRTASYQSTGNNRISPLEGTTRTSYQTASCQSTGAARITQLEGTTRTSYQTASCQSTGAARIIQLEAPARTSYQTASCQSTGAARISQLEGTARAFFGTASNQPPDVLAQLALSRRESNQVSCAGPEQVRNLKTVTTSLVVGKNRLIRSVSTTTARSLLPDIGEGC